MSASRTASESEATLIFAWKDRYHRKLRLGFFLFLSLALHVFCFYLFQVTYPKAERRLPYTAQLTVLNPKDTLTQVVLRQIDDRVVSIDSAGREAIEGMRIEDHAPVFKPFFQEYTARLKTPPAVFPKSGIADLVSAGAAVLPELPAARQSPPAAAVPFIRRPHLSIRGHGLDSRDLLQAIEWNDDIPNFESTGGFSFASFMIAVDAMGRVRHCLPAEGEESGVLPMLYRKVKSLRFQPIEGSPLQWGWVDIKW